ncbi:acyl carrier protein [Puniceicoccaceae bacterium K14]|nr:acyl carrier protein [Puniceicoccaceae bacterium K14]
MENPPSPSLTRANLITFLTERIAKRLDCPPEELHPDSNLIELGLQSVDAVLLSGDLEDTFGEEVEPTLLLNQHTINQVADKYLAPNDR